MFTGIISNIGRLTKREGSQLTFMTDTSFCKKIAKGTSIAVNGVCLTSLEKGKENYFTVEVMPETLQKTMLTELQINAIVNLELPVTPTTFLSGHIVQGHVDGIGVITSIQENGNSKIITVTVDKVLSKYIVTKGSISLNGISLTIIDTTETCFTVGIILYTWKHTMLYTVKTKDKVNIETDILTKYLQELTSREVKE